MNRRGERHEDRVIPLSIVTFIRDDATRLRSLLGALGPQVEEHGIEVVVAEGRDSDGGADLEAEFPFIRRIVTDAESIPGMKGQAIIEARGTRIGLIDPDDVPADDWVSMILDSLPDGGPVAAVGGEVARGTRGGPTDAALYLFDYGAFGPTLPAGATDRDLPGNNVAYRASDLRAAGEGMVEGGFWKLLAHERIMAAGGELHLVPGMRVRHESRHAMAGAGARRWHFGRCFGARRIRRAPTGRRILFRVAAPIVPLLLCYRHLRRALGTRESRHILAGCWPALLMICILWGLGEWTGYWFGAGTSCRRVD